jgi:putative nucleotidyltransferase with HDIG domain
LPALPRSTPHLSRPALTSLIVLVSVPGFLVLADSLLALPHTPHPLAWLITGALALVAGAFALKVPGVSANLSMADTFFITSALLFGPAPPTVAIALDSLAISWNRRPTVDRLLFNLTSPALSLWIATKVFFWLAGTGPLFEVAAPPSASVIPALAALALAYYLLNSGLLSLAVALDKGVSALQLWHRHFAVISINYFASASAAFVLVVLFKSVSPLAMAALVPVLVVFYLAMRSWLGRLEDAEQHVSDVRRLYMSTVSALSTAIEAKDGVTSDHIHRVQSYAMGLAKALNISDAETLQAIEAAALLHDTGKIAIPESILNKPGRLTPAEFETMKSHVAIGAEILSAIHFPYPVVPIVEAHHENWDGSGYPRGIAGDAIPIGARILSVVDCFDALTTNRPYRAAMREKEALAVLLERRGTFYDPDVVDTFIRVYRDLAPGEPQPQLQQALRHIRPAPREPIAPPRVQPTAVAAAAQQVDSSEELLAFVSLARVTSGTPRMTDVGALAWSHLRLLAPGASLALFVIDQAQRTLVAEYSAGPAADILAGMSMSHGQRVSGWVAANARTMVNADALLDFGREQGGLRWALSIPLVADGVVAGVMSLYSQHAFAEVCSRQLEMIAPHLAVAVTSVVNARTGMGLPALGRFTNMSERAPVAARLS